MWQRKSAWRGAPDKNREEMTDEERSANNTPPRTTGDQDAEDVDNLDKVQPIPAVRRKKDPKGDKFALTEEQKQKIRDAFDLFDRSAPPHTAPPPINNDDLLIEPHLLRAHSSPKKLNVPETSTGVSPCRNDDDQALKARGGCLLSRRTRSGRKQLAPEVALALFRESERMNLSMSISIDQLLFTEPNSPMTPM